MPKLVRLYIIQSLIGFAIAAVFLAGLLALNVANLRTLIFQSDVGIGVLILLFLVFGSLFAGVQFAISVMQMAEDEDPPTSGLKDFMLEPDPIVVRAK